MVVDVYIDVLFAVNLLMNYILLWLTAIFTKSFYRWWRLLLSAGLGAVYAVCVFFLPLHFVYSFAGKLVVSAMLVFAAFGCRIPKRFVKVLCVFYACVFTLGGVGFALFYFSKTMQKIGAVVSNGVFYVNLPIYMLLVIAVITYAVLNVAFYFTKRRAGRSQLFQELLIMHRGRNVRLRALIDTGNVVTEPKSGKQVIIAEWEKVAPLFPGKESGDQDGFTVIPYTTIGDGDGILMGFLPEEIYLVGKGLTPLPALYVGIVNRKLDRADEYQAILPELDYNPPTLFQREKGSSLSK